MRLFRQKYRVESTRLAGWDYRTSGYYFVTICTKGREPFFGEVTNGDMALSTIGEIVAGEWKGMAVRRRDVGLDEWVVMPNHVHAIIVLKERRPVETPQRERAGDPLPDDPSLENRHIPEDSQRGVSTASGLLAGSLGAIIGQFKSRSTKRIWRATSREFGWQPRFYDHVIRNEESLNQIRRYIIDNPMKWEQDRDNVENLYM